MKQVLPNLLHRHSIRPDPKLPSHPPVWIQGPLPRAPHPLTLAEEGELFIEHLNLVTSSGFVNAMCHDVHCNFSLLVTTNLVEFEFGEP